MRDARAGVYGAECLTQSGFEGFDQVGVGAGQEGVGHFDDCDGASQCRVNTAEFEADDASANDEEAFGYFVEVECCCRVQNARCVERKNWKGDRARTRGDDGVFKFYAVDIPIAFDRRALRILKLRVARQVGDFALAHQARQSS